MIFMKYKIDFNIMWYIRIVYVNEINVHTIFIYVWNSNYIKQHKNFPSVNLNKNTFVLITHLFYFTQNGMKREGYLPVTNMLGVFSKLYKIHELSTLIPPINFQYGIASFGSQKNEKDLFKRLKLNKFICST